MHLIHNEEFETIFHLQKGRWGRRGR